MPGQAISWASFRSSAVAAMAASACESRASRSTTSSASAARQAFSSTPGGLHRTGTSSTATTRRTTGPRLVVREDQAGGGGDALEVAAGTFGLGVAVDQLPEARAVTGHDQVGQLVQQHVVDHPVGHLLNAV